MSDFSDSEIEAMLESGDQAKVDEALAYIDSMDPWAKQDEAEKRDTDKPEPVANGDDDDSDDDEGKGDTSGQDPDNARKVLKSKDGAHEIPYTVLEEERRMRREAEQRAAELERQRIALEESYSKTESALNNVKTRLEQQGADVEQMLANPDEITKAEWNEIEQDYGQLGKIMRSLVEKQQANVRELDAGSDADPEAMALQAALDANPEILKWEEQDEDRFTMAVSIDNELKVKPEWASKTVSERFAHVVQLTNQAFGAKPSAKQRAKQIIDDTDPELPTSLSDMGHAPTATKSDAEALKDMTPEQLEAAMERMTSAQIEELFRAGF